VFVQLQVLDVVNAPLKVVAGALIDYKDFVIRYNGLLDQSSGSLLVR
jgi:hypothetical protein